MSKRSQQFILDDPKYFCCCGCSILTGAKIVASIYTILAVFQTVPLIACFDQTDISNEELLINSCAVIAAVIIFVALGLLWYGLIRERKRFLVPFLVLLMLNIIMHGISAILCIILMFSLIDQGADEIFGSKQDIGVLLAALSFIIGSSGMQCWFFGILKNAYDYIKHKRWFPARGGIAVYQMEQAFSIESKSSQELEADGSELVEYSASTEKLTAFQQ